jgi:hypothetical protein
MSVSFIDGVCESFINAGDLFSTFPGTILLNVICYLGTLEGVVVFLSMQLKLGSRIIYLRWLRSVSFIFSLSFLLF